MVKPVTYGGSKRKELKVYKEKQSIPNKLLSLVTPSVQAGVIGTWNLTQAPRRENNQAQKAAPHRANQRSRVVVSARR
jgi:hypothetical protein